MALKIVLDVEGNLEKMPEENRKNLSKLMKSFKELSDLIDCKLKTNVLIESGTLTGWDLEREEENAYFMEERLQKELKTADDLLKKVFGAID